MKMRTIMTAGLISALLLSGCGETIPETPATVPPASEGLWTGSLLFSPTAKSASLLMLGNGSLWLVYTKPGSTDVGGIIQSNVGAPNASTYAAFATKEFNLEGVAGPTDLNLFSTTLVAGSQFLGTIAYPATTTTLAVSVNFQSLFNLNNTAARPTINGTFAGTTGSKAGLAISSTEAMSSLSVNTTSTTFPNISGTVSGCNVSGTILPLEDTKAYLVQLTFAGSAGACSNATGSTGAVAGVAFIDANSKLNVLALNSARSNGFVFRQN
jgi:hypothetical protein